MPMMDDYRKIGIALSTGGVAFTFLGIMMFFDRGLLAMGNVRCLLYIYSLVAHLPLVTLLLYESIATC